MVCSQDWRWIWRATLKWSEEICIGRTDAISVLLDTQRWPRIGCPLSDLTWSSASFLCSDLTLVFEVSLSLIFKIKYDFDLCTVPWTLERAAKQYFVLNTKQKTILRKKKIERPMLFIICKGHKAKDNSKSTKAQERVRLLSSIVQFLDLVWLGTFLLGKGLGIIRTTRSLWFPDNLHIAILPLTFP